MAKVIIEGERVGVTVEHTGPLFNIWRVERAVREYAVFCNQRSGVSITFSGTDADELEADLTAVHAGSSTPQALEKKIDHKIDAFLGGASNPAT
jgi:hypothetical protein